MTLARPARVECRRSVAGDPPCRSLDPASAARRRCRPAARVLEHRAEERDEPTCRAITRSPGACASASRRARPRPVSGSTISGSLAREFGVTLMTLRQALELLERDGPHRAAPRTRHLRRAPSDRLRHPAAPRASRATSPPRARTWPRGCSGSRFGAAGSPGGPRARPAAARARVLAVERLRLVDGPPDEPAALLPAGARSARRWRKADLAVTPLRQVLDVQARHRHHGARARASPRCGLGRARRAGARLPRAASPPSAPTASRSTPAGAADRLRSRLHPGRPLPDHPGASVRPVINRSEQTQRSLVMKILVMIKQVPDTATQVKIAGDGRADRHRRHHLDRLALRRVRRRGGAADQGEARPGRGGRRLARPRPRQGGAALLPGHGRDRAIHLNDPAWTAPTR